MDKLYELLTGLEGEVLENALRYLREKELQEQE